MRRTDLVEWINDLLDGPTDGDAIVAQVNGYFAASVMPGDGSTYSVWTRSLRTALPKTDLVVLLDDTGATHADILSGELKHDMIWVPWDVFARHMGPRLVQKGLRYYVEPGDFPDEETRRTLGKPPLCTLDRPAAREATLRVLLPRIRETPGVIDRAEELGGELPVLLLVDPTEEFNLQRLDEVPLRIEVREQMALVLFGRVEEQIAYTAEPWARALPTN